MTKSKFDPKLIDELVRVIENATEDEQIEVFLKKKKVTGQDIEDILHEAEKILIAKQSPNELKDDEDHDDFDDLDEDNEELDDFEDLDDFDDLEDDEDDEFEFLTKDEDALAKDLAEEKVEIPKNAGSKNNIKELEDIDLEDNSNNQKSQNQIINEEIKDLKELKIEGEEPVRKRSDLEDAMFELDDNKELNLLTDDDEIDDEIVESGSKKLPIDKKLGPTQFERTSLGKEKDNDLLLDIVQGTEKSNRGGMVVHKMVPTSTIISNSFSQFFYKLHKYFLLFFLHLLIPVSLYFFGQESQNVLIQKSGIISFFLLLLIYPISLAKFIEDGDEGHIFALRYSISHFIPIFFTILLISLVVSNIASLTKLVAFFPEIANSPYLFWGDMFFLFCAVIVAFWYSFAFFVMTNEEEFYAYSIAKSRAYVKDHLSIYIARIVVFCIIHAIILAFVTGILGLILYFTGSFDLKSFISDPNINYFLPANLDKITTISLLVMLFFALTIPIIFLQIIYEDFALDNRTGIRMSKKHQNLFYILLVLTPLLNDFSVQKFSDLLQFRSKVEYIIDNSNKNNQSREIDYYDYYDENHYEDYNNYEEPKSSDPTFEENSQSEE